MLLWTLLQGAGGARGAAADGGPGHVPRAGRHADRAGHRAGYAGLNDCQRQSSLFIVREAAAH